MISRALWLALALMLPMTAGCAMIPPDAPGFTRAADPAAGLENVYIYRIGATPYLRSPVILINNKEVASPPEGSYTVIPLAPGVYSVVVTWTWDTGEPAEAFPIFVESGASYYLKLGSDRGDNRVLPTVYKAHNMPRDTAEAEMKACCRYISPRKD